MSSSYLIQRFSKLSVMTNKSSKVIGKSQETPHLTYSPRYRPILNSLKFLSIWSNCASNHAVSLIKCFRCTEETLGRYAVQLIFPKSFKYQAYMLDVFLPVSTEYQIDNPTQGGGQDRSVHGPSSKLSNHGSSMPPPCGAGENTSKLVKDQELFCHRHKIVLPQLQQRFDYHTLVLFFKIKSNLAPPCLTELLPQLSSHCGYNFRKKNCIRSLL